KAMRRREDTDFVPWIEHPSQSKIKEISAAARSVKNADFGQFFNPIEKRVLQLFPEFWVGSSFLLCSGFGKRFLVRSLRQCRGFSLYHRPLPLQRLDYYRLHDKQNVFPAGVVCACL